MSFVRCAGLLVIAAWLGMASPSWAEDKPAESGSKMPDFLKSALGSLKPEAKSDMKDSRCHAIIGTWRGLGADRVIVSEDGKLRSGQQSGTWSCADPAARKFAVNLPSGRVIMVLEPKATRASARDDQGHLYVAHKEDGPKPAVKPPAVIPTGPCVVAIGHWLWPDGAKVTLAASGLALNDRQTSGHWRCVDKAELKIGVQFGATAESILTLSPDHARLEGASADGWPFVAERH